MEGLRRFFFNPDLIEKYYLGFSYLSNPYVCSGILFGKRDFLRLEDYERFFEIKSKEPDLFFQGEHGFLNFILFLMAQKGEIRLFYWVVKIFNLFSLISPIRRVMRSFRFL